EAVADAEDELLLVAEPAERVAEEVLELKGEHLSRRHVVAVAEAAGHDEDLEVAELSRVLAEGVHMDPLRDRAGQLEGGDGLAVAVGAGCSEDQCVRGGHDEKSGKETVCA